MAATANGNMEQGTGNRTAEPGLVAISIDVPVGPAPAAGEYASRRADVRLDERTARALRRVTVALDRRGARLADGKRVVDSAADAVNWILEQIAAAVEAGEPG